MTIPDDIRPGIEKDDLMREKLVKFKEYSNKTTKYYVSFNFLYFIK